MNLESVMGIVNNAALLLVLGLLYDILSVRLRPVSRPLLHQLLIGIVLGIMGVAVMLNSWVLMPGMMFDTRSILLCVSGLFFGGIPTSVAMVITGAYRASIGGPGVWMGLSVIFTSGVIGILWRRVKRGSLGDIAFIELLALGLVVHVVMVACMLLLPGSVRQLTLVNLWLPLLVVYPTGTALLGMLMSRRHARLRVENDLRESEARYRSYVGGAPHGVFIASATGHYVDVNPAACEITGYPEQELIGLHLAQLCPPEWKEAGRRHFQEVLEKGRATGELGFIRKDGQLRHWSVTAVRLPDDRYMGFVEDITERKRSEALLEARIRIREYAQGHTLDELLQKVLDETEALTGSAMGFYHFVDSDQDSVRLQTWSTNTLEHMCKAEGQGMHYPLSEAGVWTDCVQTRKPVIHNDYASLPHRRGTPEGHAHLIRELVVPVFRGDLFMAILGIGNKPSDYTEEDVSTVSLLADLAWDITERKCAEEALAASEERLHLALEGGELGIWDWDIRTGRAQFDWQWAAMLGRELNDLEPNLQTWKDLTHPDDMPKALETLQAHLDGLLPMYEAEMRMLHSDGSWVWVLDRGKVIMRDANGMPLRACGTHLDITPRVHTERSIRENEARYRALFGATSDAIYAFYLDDCGMPGRFFEVNDMACELLGYTREELLGMTVADIDAPDSETDVPAVMADLATGSEMLFLQTHRTKDGRRIPVEVHARTFTYQGKKAIFSTTRDISERLLAQEALMKSEERLGRVLDSMSTIAVQGFYDDGTVFYWNKANETVYGYTAEEAVGRKFIELIIPPPMRETVEKTIRAGAETGVMLPVEELTLMRKDGSFVPVLSNHLVVEIPGRPVELYCIDIDLTAQKAAEEARIDLERQVQQTQKLESLGVLAGGIAHDFNNILMAVMGHADMALLDLPGGSPAVDSIREISTAAHRAAELCRQMLAYSGRGRFVIENVDMSTMVEEMVHLLQASVSKKVVLTLNLAKDLPPVRGDATQLRQVAMNLVINASEAIGDDTGYIIVATGTTRLTGEELHATPHGDGLPPGEYVCFEVADTGCGMDGETLGRVFEPFFTTKFTGRGLGMAAVLGIMRGHKGTLTVDSKPGKGTTFRMLFPVAESRGDDVATSSHSGDTSTDWHGSGTVLLVDDEETVRTLSRKMLERLGFSVLLAENGLEALEVYKARSPEIDLVLLDLTMPRMNGEETFNELIRMNPSIRVVMSSGYTESDINARLGGKGLTGFVQKPYTMAALRDCLKPFLSEDAASP